MIRLFILTLWFTLILGGVANAQSVVGALNSTPIMKILYIGVGSTMIGYIVEAVGAGSWGKFIRISGLLSAIILVAYEAKKALNAILHIG